MSSEHDATLERLRAQHESGNKDSARYALWYCAGVGIPMPLWLADLVITAINTSNEGRVDNLLGFGNDKMRREKWKRDHAKARDLSVKPAIRDAIEQANSQGRRVKVKDLVQEIADAWDTGYDTIEAANYPPKSPSRKSPKRTPEN